MYYFIASKQDVLIWQNIE